MLEEWRDVVGYEDFYQVSSYGKVRSLDRVIARTARGVSSNYTKPGALMSQSKKGSFYMRVCLSKESKSNKHYVHRLVAQAFKDNPHSLPCVNHLDGDKMNNNKDNLKWCTHAENNQHAKDLGLHNVHGEGCHLSKLTSIDVLDICDKLDNKDMTYKEIANHYSITPENVSYIDKGKTWKAVTGRGFSNA